MWSLRLPKYNLANFSLALSFVFLPLKIILRLFHRIKFQMYHEQNSELNSKGYNLRPRDNPSLVLQNAHTVEIMEEIEVERKEDILVTPKLNRLRERNPVLDLKHERKGQQNKQDLTPTAGSAKKNLFKEEKLQTKEILQLPVPKERGLWMSGDKPPSSSSLKAAFVPYEKLATCFQEVLVSLLNCTSVVEMANRLESSVIPYFNSNTKVSEQEYKDILLCYENALRLRKSMDSLDELSFYYKEGVFKFRKVLKVKICDVLSTESLMGGKSMYWSQVFLTEVPGSEFSISFTGPDKYRLYNELEKSVTLLQTLRVLCRPLTDVLEPGRRFAEDKRLGKLVAYEKCIPAL